MFGNLGVRTLMLISVSVVVALFSATFLVVGVSLAHLKQDAELVDEQTLPYILVIDVMDLSRSDVQQFLTDVSATHDRGGYKEAEESANRFLEGVEKYKQLFRKNNDEPKLKQIQAIEDSFKRFYASGKVMAEAYINSGIEAGNLLMKGPDGVSGFDKDSEDIARQLEEFRTQQVADAHKNTAATASKADMTTRLMIIGGLLASLISMILAAWITRSILGKMGGEPDYAAEVVKRVAGGDLTTEVNIKTNDKSSLLFAVNDMIRRISAIVANIRNSTESITTASQEIATGNADLSQRTEQQAASLEQTTSSMQELLSAVRANVESARHAYQLVQGSCDIAEQSGKDVDMLVATMTSINESSKKIEDIISVIDGIAFQTNILALNAAVEAARAGEQGRGFAVVAAEVRNLAQRSATAAKEISLLIGGSVEKVHAGSMQVKKAADSLGDLVTSVQLVSSLMKDISANSSDQSMSIEQVNAALVQMDEVTQQNAALVEEASAAAESMQEQAEGLLKDVSVFKLNGAGTLSRKAAKPAAKPVATRQRPRLDKPAATHAAPRLTKAQADQDDDWKEF